MLHIYPVADRQAIRALRNIVAGEVRTEVGVGTGNYSFMHL